LDDESIAGRFDMLYGGKKSPFPPAAVIGLLERKQPSTDDIRTSERLARPYFFCPYVVRKPARR